MRVPACIIICNACASCAHLAAVCAIRHGRIHMRALFPPFPLYCPLCAPVGGKCAPDADWRCMRRWPKTRPRLCIGPGSCRCFCFGCWCGTATASAWGYLYNLGLAGCGIGMRAIGAWPRWAGAAASCVISSMCGRAEWWWWRHDHEEAPARIWSHAYGPQTDAGVTAGLKVHQIERAAAIEAGTSR